MNENEKIMIKNMIEGNLAMVEVVGRFVSTYDDLMKVLELMKKSPVAELSDIDPHLAMIKKMGEKVSEGLNMTKETLRMIKTYIEIQDA